MSFLAHCELLCLKKDDFDVVLKSTVQKQWNEVHEAMRLFTYFDEWDDIAIRECCILSKMKSYVPDQVVLGDNQGLHDYVYFILKGQCRIIEHLVIQTYIKNGNKYYKMYQRENMDILEEQDNENASATYSTVTQTVREKPRGNLKPLQRRGSIPESVFFIIFLYLFCYNILAIVKKMKLMAKQQHYHQRIIQKNSD